MMSGIVYAWLNKDTLGKTGNRLSASAAWWEGGLCLVPGGKEGCAWYLVGRRVAPGRGWEGVCAWYAVLRHKTRFCNLRRPSARTSGRTGRTFRCC